jgi:PAS domain S-box-containing protein
MNAEITELLIGKAGFAAAASASDGIDFGLETILNSIPDRIFIKDCESRFVKINGAAAKRLGLECPDQAIGKTDFDFMPPEKAREFREDEQRIIQTGEPTINKAEKQILPGGQVGWTSTTKVPLRDAVGKIVGLVGVNRDITDLVHAQEAVLQARDELELRVAARTTDLAQANLALQKEIEQRDKIQKALSHNHHTLRTLVDNLPDIIFIKDAESRFLLVNTACARQLGLSHPDEAVGKTDADFVTPELARRYRADEFALMQSGSSVHQEEPTLHKASGKIGCSLTTKLSVKDSDGKVIGLMGIARDITPLKDAEKKLEAVHKDLVDAARAAGMAEVAIGVLHNVGNVLNSVNVSAGFICEHLSNSKLASLPKVITLLRERSGDLPHFLTQDERGRQVLPYLEKLVLTLQGEQDDLHREVKDLDAKIKHIAEIVAAQQNHARGCGVVEMVNLAELAEDALKLHGASYARHGVSLVREFNPVSPIPLDKHKVLQILVNLFNNAKQACEAAGRQDKQVVIRIKAAGENRIKFQVADNGIGISPENLTRIFSQGFTTRKDGHGFGLHSGALDAHELGGSLSVHSDGLGTGATFTLELPATAPEESKGPDRVEVTQKAESSDIR